MWQIRFRLHCEPTIPERGRTLSAMGTLASCSLLYPKLLNSPLDSKHTALGAVGCLN